MRKKKKKLTVEQQKYSNVLRKMNKNIRKGKRPAKKKSWDIPIETRIPKEDNSPSLDIFEDNMPLENEDVRNKKEKEISKKFKKRPQK